MFVKKYVLPNQHIVLTTFVQCNGMVLSATNLFPTKGLVERRGNAWHKSVFHIRKTCR